MSITIKRSLLYTTVSAPEGFMGTREAELLDYAVSVFSYLLPRSQSVTLPEFADMITDVYDKNNERIAATVDYLKHISKKITGE